MLSRLDYCNAVLAGLPTTTLAPLQRVLNAAARVILDMRPGDHANPDLLELHWYPVIARVKYKLCLLAHKAVVGNAPRYIADLLKPAAEIPAQSALRVSTQEDFMVWQPRLKIAERAFSVAALRVWNQLSTKLKLCRSTALFKRKLKTFVYFVI